MIYFGKGIWVHLLETRVESGDALPKEESQTFQPAWLVGRDKSRRFQSLAALEDFKMTTSFSSLLETVKHHPQPGSYACDGFP